MSRTPHNPKTPSSLRIPGGGSGLSHSAAPKWTLDAAEVAASARAASRHFDPAEESVRRRFETTLIEERARLKARLDGLESEHQTLLGNVRRLQVTHVRATQACLRRP